MQKSTIVFDKNQRRLISDLIRGLNPGTAPVVDYSYKVQELLLKWEIDIQRTTIHQQIWWASNSQDTFRAAYEILKIERPDQVKDLFNGHQLMSLQPIEA